MPKKKENRGGARKGAGRPRKPPKEYSEEFKKKLWKAIADKAKKTGKTIYDVIMEMAYNPRTQDAVRLGIFKAIMETMVIKETKSTRDVTTRDLGPGVALPPVQQRPPEADEKEREFRVISGGGGLKKQKGE